MTIKFKTIKCNRPFVGLFILLTLALSVILVAANSDTSAESRTNCVSMGYLYRTSPAVNNGQGYCVFPDGSWCDASAFQSGECGPRPFNPFIAVDYYGQTGDRSVLASSVCLDRGGQLRTVHTPYGDTILCAFPDGSTVDLGSLYGGQWGYDSGYAWDYYAQSWLNAP
jgi:putative hemolysin